MPTYDYTCENCGLEFEQFQGIKAKPLRKCPKCEKLTLKRLIGSGSGIIFKGAGFYQTDYRSESYKKSEKGEKTTADTSTAKPEAKTKSEDSKYCKETKTKTKDKKRSA